MDEYRNVNLTNSRDGHLSTLYSIGTVCSASAHRLNVVKSDLIATTDALITTKGELKTVQNELQAVKDEMRSIKQMLYNTIALYKLKTRVD